SRRVLRRSLSVGGRDVLVEPEEVVRVVLRLDRPQPLPRRAGVGGTDARLTLVGEEVHVRAGVTVPERIREVGDPRLAYGPVVGAVVEGGDVDHDPARAVR